MRGYTYMWGEVLWHSPICVNLKSVLLNQLGDSYYTYAELPQVWLGIYLYTRGCFNNSIRYWRLFHDNHPKPRSMSYIWLLPPTGVQCRSFLAAVMLSLSDFQALIWNTNVNLTDLTSVTSVSKLWRKRTLN